MLYDERLIPLPHIYPPDEWNLVDKQFNPTFLS